MSLQLTEGESTLVQVMAWCHQPTSHHLSQWWPRSMSPYGVTRPQRVYSMPCISYKKKFRFFIQLHQKHISPWRKYLARFAKEFSWIKSCILIDVWLKIVFKAPMDIKSTLVQWRGWHHTISKLLPEPMMTNSLMNASFTGLKELMAHLHYHQDMQAVSISMTAQAHNTCIFFV